MTTLLLVVGPLAAVTLTVLLLGRAATTLALHQPATSGGPSPTVEARIAARLATQHPQGTDRSA